MPKHLLDNIAWQTLTGPHAAYSVGTGGARRYAPGFSAIAGFEDREAPRLADLEGHCARGEGFYCSGWSGAAPTGWRIDKETTMFLMVWEQEALPADDADGAVQLQPSHVQQALALTEITQPGPFGPRTTELGDYFGYFDGHRLVAMAGERMRASTLTEVSGVCTHPDYRGRGMAQRLMRKLVCRIVGRGEKPFLHVVSANTAAHDLYRRMGFRDYSEAILRFVVRAE